MDTLASEETTYSLPSPRDLLLSSSQEQQPMEDSPVDKMMVDEPYETEDIQPSCEKPQLPSISNIQPYSPIPHSYNVTSNNNDNPTTTANSDITTSPTTITTTTTTTNSATSLHGVPASDEYLRHRMSDMSMSAVSGGLPLDRSRSNNSTVPPPGSSPNGIVNNNNNTVLSPLEPSHYDGSVSYSRRGSLVNMPPSSLHHDYRRPSITELGSLPLPTTSTSTSRRDSIATITTDYDYHTSRSPSPSPFKQHHHQQRSSDMDYSSSAGHIAPPSYDSFHRRHSIATAEPSHSSSSNRFASKHRPFRFPATIHESPNGIYSAPSSPPEIMNSTNGEVNTGTTHELGSSKYPRTHNMRHGGDHLSGYSSHHHQQQHHHHHQQQNQRVHHGHPYAGSYSRRRSILNDEDTPSLARRASMPVVTMGRAPASGALHHPPTPTPTPPHHHHLGHTSHQYQKLSSSSRLGGSDSYNTTTGGSTMIDEEQELEGRDKGSSGRKSETPYSRSPELRVSHKLAERKRRKEMKELFDELRDSLPVEKNLKTSKWEILSKAVEYITALKRRDFEKENEVNSLRHELAMMKRERSGSYGTLPY